MPWVRLGECNRCGDCCKGDPIDNDPTREYCPLFKWLMLEEGKVGSCTNRKHPYYLRGCINFPEHPSQIVDKPNCSYSFEWVDGTVKL